MGFFSTLGHGVILVGGLLGCIALTADLRNHISALSTHLRSGSWEVMTDRSTIEEMLRAKYSDSSRWAIHFVAASGQAFPLQNSTRRETIRNIGQQTLAEARDLRFNSTPLQTAYGGFLAHALLELTVPFKDSSAHPFRLLADELVAKPSVTRKPLEPSTYRRAQDALANLPRTSTLKKALADYDEFGRGHSLEFPSFEVGTVPSDDAPGEWDKAALTLQQLGRCKAKVQPSASSEARADAYVSLMPRLLEVSLDRRWLSSALLDESLEKKGSLTSPYFQSSGDLQLIPERLWVLLPNDALVEPLTKEDRATISTWATQGTCCVIVCEDASTRPFTLSSITFRAKAGGSQLSFRRADQTPLLYAVVSRQRALR